MTPEEFLNRLQGLRIGQSGDRRAPHKPLTLLYALGQIGRNDNRLHLFEDVETPITEMLKSFGPQRKVHHVNDPFLRLAGDGVWEVSLEERFSDSGAALWPSALKDQGAAGGFSQEVYDLLRGNPKLVAQAAQLLLDTEFPPTFHREILDQVGLLGTAQPSWAIPRDPKFRKRVLEAYESRCVICDYEIRIEDLLVGLEAAHIFWHAMGGPGDVNNGLALCANHHSVFDRGGISVDDDLTLLVGPELRGQAASIDWFLPPEGTQIRPPVNDQDRPNLEYLAWHREEVYRNAAH